MAFHSILEFSTNSIHGYVRSPMPPTSVGAASKARLPAGGKASDISAVIEATERAGTCTRLRVRRWSPMESWISASRSAAVERVAMVKIAAVVIEVVAIDDRAAVGDVGVVVVNRARRCQS